MIDRAIKSRCHAADRGTYGADRRRGRRGLVQPCTTPRGAVRSQLLVMSRLRGLPRGLLLRPLLGPYERNRSLTHGRIGGWTADTMTTEIDEDEFRRSTTDRFRGIAGRFPGIRRAREISRQCYVNRRVHLCGALQSSFIRLNEVNRGIV